MEQSREIFGTPVVSGMAYAPALWVVRPAVPSPSAPSLPDSERPAAFEAYVSAAQAVSDRLLARGEVTIGQTSDVLKMTAALAKDRGIRKEVGKLIAQGVPAVQALVRATDHFIDLFLKAGGLMAERVTDLRDVRDRVVAELEGRPEPGVPAPATPSILLADDLAPADTAGLDPHLIVAIATERGGPTSHTAIIARQLGIPCIVAVRHLSEISEGEAVLLDGARGALMMGCAAEGARELVARDRVWRDSLASWRGPGATKDGTRIQLLVNVQDGLTATKAAESQAEGVGLFRTELSFLDADTEPSFEEQKKIYGEVFQTFPESKVVVRTLDAGSDKPIVYANLDHEDNPALGVRGLRITGRNPELLSHQLDAIAAAAQGRPEGSTWVMAPMVSTLSETRWFAQEVRSRGLTAGIMVEVPAVAILAPRFLELVDFVSIGTNDLTQYTMAADRLSSHLAEYTDPWQPAVLTLIAHVALAGRTVDTPVGVCGEAAADPALACVLVGMGVTSLSMASSAIAGVGAQLGAVTLAQCEEAAAAVAHADNGVQARALARAALGIG